LILYLYYSGHCQCKDNFGGKTCQQYKEVFYNFTRYLVTVEYSIQSKHRNFWFKDHFTACRCIPALVNGFHHDKNTYMMLCRCLSTNEMASFPLHSHTTMGDSAFIINGPHQMLED
uniref:Laminin EGF-like domain-containing protein n=1 Tax=Anopheles maculatus TaxID=74869 RepID=A0A182SYR0_9DIPT